MFLFSQEWSLTFCMPHIFNLESGFLGDNLYVPQHMLKFDLYT